MIFYNSGIWLLHFFVWVHSLFNAKSKLFREGRKQAFKKLELFHQHLNGDEIVYWFHCASLGEFEQARPLIEQIKTNTPEIKVAISFFSPSGYEVQQKYALADVIFYLPMATKSNALKVLALLQPQKIFFIKYEFWLNYIREAYLQKIPVYLVSALFRPRQIFFRWYGRLFYNILKCYRKIFVQDESSRFLLERHKITSIVTGDTRFDRVLSNKAKAKHNELIELFADGKKIVVLGSSWQKEEALIFKTYRKDLNYKIIIAPHNISRSIVVPEGFKVIKYSEAGEDNLKDKDVLIIDNIGMLASLYSYATIAFVGGGFRSSLHNILEAAVFGIPVLFGNKTKKHPEAELLQGAGGGVIIEGEKQLKSVLNRLLSDPKQVNTMGNNASRFITQNAGATRRILSEI